MLDDDSVPPGWDEWREEENMTGVRWIGKA